MDTTLTRGLHDLFVQLGLPADEASIRRFITRHRPLADSLRLPDAPFWTDAQAAFLREAWRADAEWTQVVDTLNAQLRAPAWAAD